MPIFKDLKELVLGSIATDDKNNPMAAKTIIDVANITANAPMFTLRQMDSIVGDFQMDCPTYYAMVTASGHQIAMYCSLTPISFYLDHSSML